MGLISDERGWLPEVVARLSPETAVFIKCCHQEASKYGFLHANVLLVSVVPSRQIVWLHHYEQLSEQLVFSDVLGRDQEHAYTT